MFPDTAAQSLIPLRLSELRTRLSGRALKADPFLDSGTGEEGSPSYPACRPSLLSRLKIGHRLRDRPVLAEDLDPWSVPHTGSLFICLLFLCVVARRGC